MERFVQLVVGGGVSLVAGLWLVELTAMGSGTWLVGMALAVGGAGALAYGIGGGARVVSGVRGGTAGPATGPGADGAVAEDEHWGDHQRADVVGGPQKSGSMPSSSMASWFSARSCSVRSIASLASTATAFSPSIRGTSVAPARRTTAASVSSPGTG